MAESKLSSERIRLAILLAVLAVVAVVAVIRSLGGGGIGGGRSQSGELEYEARNLQPLHTDGIGRQEDQSVESGGNPFVDYSVPEAVIRFKQGFGRLIRSRTDQGQVVVLDRRIVSKPYGHKFIAALPPLKVEVAPSALAMAPQVSSAGRPVSMWPASLTAPGTR